MKIKKRKWYHKKKIIFGIHIFVFLLFIFFYEIYTFSINKGETKNLSILLQSFLWNLDDVSAKQYLDVYLQNKNIQSIDIQHPDQSTFLKVVNPRQETILDIFLKTFWLIRNYKLESNIYQEKELIGKVIVEWKNENIYIYFYTIVFFVLLSLVAFFYIETIKHKDELEVAFKEIKKLIEQQNADYFLTSLLIEPLLYIKTTSDSFKVGYYIEQKKKFEYKKHNKEIGGDYILVKEIQLKNRNYIFFINADAMGKSLQGGSGVLVLGSLLYAITKRLEFRIEDKNKYPETWLKYLCLEIQELFESFQGSMMLSAVVGLVDNQSGILYFVNFEHPYPVIYRDGKAFFIGENHIHRKFGMPKMFQENIKIQIQELKEHDTFIVGSDGKDDLEIQQDEKEQRIINEDETLFLRIVEKSEADLKLIIQNMKKMGTLTDDLSILVLECLKKEIPIIGQYVATDTNSIETKVKNLIQDSHYEEGYYLLKPYVDLYPISNKILYYFVICASKIKKYNEAIEVGERILNRVEKFKNVYPLLIQVYSLKGDANRAKQLLEIYKSFTSEESILKKLENLIENIKEKVYKI